MKGNYGDNGSFGWLAKLVSGTALTVIAGIWCPCGMIGSPSFELWIAWLKEVAKNVYSCKQQIWSSNNIWDNSWTNGNRQTYLMREACRQIGKGVLYFEIRSAKRLPKKLAEAVGMRILPTFISNVFQKWFPSYLEYYQLPAEYIKSISFSHFYSRARTRLSWSLMWALPNKVAVGQHIIQL